jgi:hypothetical protein
MLKYLLIIMVAILASCASVPTVLPTPATPTIPEGMVLVPKDQLDIVIKNYNQLVGEHRELRECQEWRDKMFF